MDGLASPLCCCVEDVAELDQGRGWMQPVVVVVVVLSHHVRLFETPWTCTHQASLSMGCFMQEYWSGWPLQGIFLT